MIGGCHILKCKQCDGGIFNIRRVSDALSARTLVLLSLFVGVKFLSTFASRYIDANFARLAFYPVWALIVPALFHFFKTSKLDRFVGELSYPVYVIHLIIIALLRNIIQVFGLPADLLGLWSVIISVLWSVVFYLIVIQRLDVARHKITFGQG